MLRSVTLSGVQISVPLNSVLMLVFNDSNFYLLSLDFFRIQYPKNVRQLRHVLFCKIDFILEIFTFVLILLSSLNYKSSAKKIIGT